MSGTPESNHAHSEPFPTGVDCGASKFHDWEATLRSIGTLVLIDGVGMDTYTAQSLDWYSLPDGFGRRAVGSVDTARNAFVQVICTCAGSTCDTSSAVVARTTNHDCRQISAKYAIGLTRFEYCGLGRCSSSTGLRWRGIGDLSDHLRKLALSRVLFRSERSCATPPE